MDITATTRHLAAETRRPWVAPALTRVTAAGSAEGGTRVGLTEDGHVSAVTLHTPSSRTSHASISNNYAFLTGSAAAASS